MTLNGPIVVLSSTLRQIIIDLSLAASPNEACGLCLGHIDQDNRVIKHILPAHNVALDPVQHFEIDPKTLFAAHRMAREKGLHVLGHFHSHPKGGIGPSRNDADHAYEVGQLWLIQQVKDDAAGVLTAHLVVRDEHWGWPFITLAIEEPDT